MKKDSVLACEIGCAARLAGQFRREKGFTLIEVMIALFIVVLGIAAATQLTAGVADETHELERKTYAHWVAMNLWASQKIASPWPPAGTRNGRSRMAGQTWYWQENVKNLPVTGLRQIEIRVRAHLNGKTLATLDGIASQLQASATQNSAGSSP